MRPARSLSRARQACSLSSVRDAVASDTTNTSNLPIEAVLLWGAATWSNIAVYEVAKLFVHHRRRPLAQDAR